MLKANEKDAEDYIREFYAFWGTIKARLEYWMRAPNRLGNPIYLILNFKKIGSFGYGILYPQIDFLNEIGDIKSHKIYILNDTNDISNLPSIIPEDIAKYHFENEDFSEHNKLIITKIKLMELDCEFGK